MTALKIDAGLPPARLKRRKYMSTALLLIDELGFEPMTRQEASLFFRLVTYRYGRGAILITTNKSVQQFSFWVWREEVAGFGRFFGGLKGPGQGGRGGGLRRARVSRSSVQEENTR